MSAAQTIWADVVVAALAAAGVTDCVVSPGSRSTPLVAALARARTLRTTVIIDERAAGFYALGLARAGGRPVALVCTSGSAPGHYLPAVIEAAMAEVPLVVVSADRPAELLDAGAAQTIAQTRLFVEQVRAQLDLGPPTGEPLALRAVRRRVVQAVIAARGPIPGPVHINVPLRKPLEPAPPRTEAELALAAEARQLAALPPPAAPPLLAPAPEALDELARAIASEPHGLIVAGALPESFAEARAALWELARLSGYPVLAESGSQLRLGPRPDDVLVIDCAELTLPHALAEAPVRLVLALGAEPVAAACHAAAPALRRVERWAVARRWQDPSSTARVILADPVLAIAALARSLAARPLAARPPAFRERWRACQARAATAMADAIAAAPDSEVAALSAVLAACQAHPQPVRVCIGNSLPVRVLDYLAPSAEPAHWLPVSTQRGASGIDGALAGAAGAAAAGAPTVAIIGDVTFAHDVGSLALLAGVGAPLAVVVLDNGGGRIFDHLPVARAEWPGAEYARLYTTAPQLDPVAIARGFGVRAVAARSPAEVGAALAGALREPGATLIHAPVASDGALTVRAGALAALSPPLRMVQGAT